MPFVVRVIGKVDLPGIAQADTGGTGLVFHFTEGWVRLCGQLRQANPCLVFFGMLGVWFMPQKGIRILFGVVIAGLCLIGGWGDFLLPRGLLSMAVLSALFVSLVPAALWMEQWLESKAPSMAMVRAATLSILLACGLNVTDIYGNKGPAACVTMGPDMQELVDWVRKSTPEDGRVLFAGPTANKYGSGRVSCLPVYTGRELMALDDFQGDGVDGDRPLAPLKDKEKEVLGFMDLHNVGWIVTCHDGWKEFLGGQPDQYEIVRLFGDKSVFRVKRMMDQFLKGKGGVKARINELVVAVDNPLEDVVLKYNWVDGLFVEAPSEIRPFEAGKDTRLIAVSPHGKKTIRVKFRKLL
jgi:hypothetical protein